MYLSFFRPRNVKAFPIDGHAPKVALQMDEDSGSQLSIHTEDAEALVKLGEIIAAEGERLIRERNKNYELTPEEAQIAYETAEEFPISEERIEEIVRYATNPATQCPDFTPEDNP